MKHIIPRNLIEMTCGGCPSQWDAMTHTGDYVFIHVRHGYFRVEVNNVIVFQGYPEGVDGVMSTSEMIDYIHNNSETIEIN